MSQWHPVVNHPKHVAYIGTNVGYDYPSIHATQSPLPIFYSDNLLRVRYRRGGSVPGWLLEWHSTQAWLSTLPQKVAIVGSRDYPFLDDVADYVSRLNTNTVIVSGGARGVDSIAVDTAKSRKMKTLIFFVDKTGLPPYGSPNSKREFRKRAFERDQLIVDACDRLVAFQHKQSKGTQHSIDLARKAGKPVAIFDIERRAA